MYNIIWQIRCHINKRAGTNVQGANVIALVSASAPCRRPHIGCENKNFNLGHNFLTRSDKAFILHMCIPYDKTFHMVQ